MREGACGGARDTTGGTPARPRREGIAGRWGVGVSGDRLRRGVARAPDLNDNPPRPAPQPHAPTSLPPRSGNNAPAGGMVTSSARRDRQSPAAGRAPPKRFGRRPSGPRTSGVTSRRRRPIAALPARGRACGQAARRTRRRGVHTLVREFKVGAPQPPPAPPPRGVRRRARSRGGARKHHPHHPGHRQGAGARHGCAELLGAAVREAGRVLNEHRHQHTSRKRFPRRRNWAGASRAWWR